MVTDQHFEMAAVTDTERCKLEQMISEMRDRK